MSTNRIVLPGDLSEGPAVPQSFLKSLRQYDHSLLVAWNPRKKRHVIEQCIEHLASAPEHNHLCRRQYVLMAQDEEGCMMPLGEAVLNMIRAADVSRAGYGPKDLDRFNQDRQNEVMADRARIEEQQNEAIKYGSTHNKRQLNQAIHLMQQHDLRPNR